MALRANVSFEEKDRTSRTRPKVPLPDWKEGGEKERKSDAYIIVS